MHGSLFDIRCERCDDVDRDNRTDPLCPALAAAAEDAVDPTKPLPLLDPAKPLARIPRRDLPHCRACGTGLLRPGVVWFGEGLDEDMLAATDEWIDAAPVDLMLVIGTSAQVTPAASYIHEARSAGAVVAVVNIEAETPDELAKLEPGDFAFGGDAAVTLPLLLAPLVGTLEDPAGTGGATG